MLYSDVDSDADVTPCSSVASDRGSVAGETLSDAEETCTDNNRTVLQVSMLGFVFAASYA